MEERGILNRNKIQDYALYLSSVFKHVVLSWATGAGKSLAAIRIIEQYIKDNPDNYKIWYIVVSETQHIDNWTSEFEKHGLLRLIDLGYVEIFCYQSLDKYRGNEANLVLDEAHSITRARLEHLMYIKADKIVSLSATIPSDKLTLLRVLEGDLRVYSITTDQAIKASILPEPLIIKVPVTMTGEFRNKYTELSERIENNEIKLRQAKLDLLGGRSIRILNKINNLEHILLELRLKRKCVIANAKTKVASTLIDDLNNKKTRYICFTASIEQCENLGGNDSIHSLLSENRIKARIDYFQVGAGNRLFTNKMLRQGTNLNNVEAGVIVQLDAKELSFVQMMGEYLAHIP